MYFTIFKKRGEKGKGKKKREEAVLGDTPWVHCDGGWGEQSGPEDPLFGGGLCNGRSDSQGL